MRSPTLERRVRDALAGRDDLEERPMMGGVVFMLGGNMLFGVSDRGLMVRVGPDSYEEALAEPDASLMDMTGRPMRGYVVVEDAETSSDERLQAWIDRAVSFVSRLPPKSR